MPRVQERGPLIPHSDTTPDPYPEVFLPTDDVTIQVDPVNRDQWIYDGIDNRFRDSRLRGLAFDRDAFKKSKAWFEADHGSISFFSPTVSQLNQLPQYAAPMGQDCLGWGPFKRDPTRFGKLPAIEQTLRSGGYINKSHGEIEHEIREAERRHAGRVFDKDGFTR